MVRHVFIFVAVLAAVALTSAIAVGGIPQPVGMIILLVAAAAALAVVARKTVYKKMKD